MSVCFEAEHFASQLAFIVHVACIRGDDFLIACILLIARCWGKTPYDLADVRPLANASKASIAGASPAQEFSMQTEHMHKTASIFKIAALPAARNHRQVSELVLWYAKHKQALGHRPI